MIAFILVHLARFHRRMLVVWCALLGPRLAYAVTGGLARTLYGALDPLRLRSETQCEAALAGTTYANHAKRIAKEAFVHRAWNLTDLYLADRLVHAGTYRRYGGQISEPYLSELLTAQRDGRPTILLTGYYGPFDMLPLLLGFNGIRCGAVYLPHADPAFDAYRRRIRGRSGTELIPANDSTGRLGSLLAAGGTVAIIADHYDERRGMPVTFLGLPTRAMRSVGLLAWRYNAGVVVAGIRRTGRQFHFEVLVRDVIPVAQWSAQTDPVAYITDRYLRALATMILEDPSQYLWAYPRWGKELAGSYHAPLGLVPPAAPQALSAKD